MFTGNSTIDYSIEVHTLDAHKTSAAPNMNCYSSANCHGNTAENRHGSSAGVTKTNVPNSLLLDR